MFVFLLQAAFISLSASMSPGPITAVAIGQGSRSPHAGALITIGHAAFEFPFMVGIFLGVGAFLTLAPVKAGIFALGGVALLWMGIGMVRSVRIADMEVTGGTGSPLLAGVVLTVTNPYFFVWWATVGAMLVMKALGFGLLGFLLFVVVHWLCDLAWNYLLSAVSYKGGHVFGPVFQRVLFTVCGALLILFGGTFFFNALRLVFG